MLQHRLLSPWVCRFSCQDPAPAWAYHGVMTFFWASLCSAVGSHRGCRWIPALAPPALTWVCRAVPVTYSPFFCGHIYFCAIISVSSLNRLSQQHFYHLMCLAFASWLALELSDMGKLLKEAILVSPPHPATKTLLHSPSGKDQAVLLYIIGIGR